MQMLLCICWLVPYALVVSTSCLFPATTVAIFSQLRWTCLSTVGRWLPSQGWSVGCPSMVVGRCPPRVGQWGLPLVVLLAFMHLLWKPMAGVKVTLCSGVWDMLLQSACTGVCWVVNYD